MANFDSPHIYVQWGGKLPGNEEWSCGFRLRRKTGVVQSGEGANVMPGLVTAIQAFHSSGNTNIGTGAKLQFVKSNAVSVDGHYMDPNGTNQTILADIPGGGTSQQTFPNQVALAVTLTTGFTRGPAHKGRFYLPLPNGSIDANGLMSASAAIAISGAVDSLITAVNAVDANYEMAVFSRRPSGPGNRKVTGNLIGRAFDTQRRRRRKLVEDYQ